MSRFIAIDFETANERRHSACAVGLVRVEQNRIVAKEYRLINPMDTFRWFCVQCHGITADDVAKEPSFDRVWNSIGSIIEGADYFVAHNAPFDRGVLEATCAHYTIKSPPLPFQCTLSLSRQLWPGLKNYQLSTVCQHLKIDLNHHHALSDAEACAQIMIQAAGS